MPYGSSDLLSHSSDCGSVVDGSVEIRNDGIPYGPIPTRLSKADKKELKRQRIQEKYKAQKDAKRAKSKARDGSAELATETEQIPTPLTHTVDLSSVLRRSEKHRMEVECFEARIRSRNTWIVIDCDERYMDQMSEQELTSLCQQVCFCYSLNRKSVNPVSILVTGITELMKAQLSKMSGMDKWAGIYLTDMALPVALKALMIDSSECQYLSADADAVLDEARSEGRRRADSGSLEPRVLIIGGMVDRNRFTLASLSRAEMLGIPPKRLPEGSIVRGKKSRFQGQQAARTFARAEVDTRGFPQTAVSVSGSSSTGEESGCVGSGDASSDGGNTAEPPLEPPELMSDGPSQGDSVSFFSKAVSLVAIPRRVAIFLLVPMLLCYPYSMMGTVSIGIQIDFFGKYDNCPPDDRTCASAAASKYMGYVDACQSLASSFGSFYLGKLSDVYGRKPFMVISSAVNLFASVPIFFRHNLWPYISIMLVGYLLGSDGSAIWSAYISDSAISPRAKITSFGVYNALYQFGTAVMPPLGTYLNEKEGWSFLCVIVMGCYGFAVLYTLLVVPESLASRKTVQAARHPVRYLDMISFRKSPVVAYCMLSSLFVTFPMSAGVEVIQIYLTEVRGFTTHALGMYMLVWGIGGMFANLVLLPVCERYARLTDKWMLAISLLSLVLFYGGMAFVDDQIGIYCVVILSLPSYFLASLIPSLIGAHISSLHQGQAQGFKALLDGAVNFAAPIFSSTLLSQYMGSDLHSIVWIALSGIAAIGLTFTLLGYDRISARQQELESLKLRARISTQPIANASMDTSSVAGSTSDLEPKEPRDAQVRNV